MNSVLLVGELPMLLMLVGLALGAGLTVSAASSRALIRANSSVQFDEPSATITGAATGSSIRELERELCSSLLIDSVTIRAVARNSLHVAIAVPDPVELLNAVERTRRHVADGALERHDLAAYRVTVTAEVSDFDA